MSKIPQGQFAAELLGHFGRPYPRCAGLAIRPLATTDGQGYRPGYDIDDVQGMLGTTRFNKLLAGVSAIFVYDGKRSIHADDLEKFLAGGN